jgi:glycosyltransferase involved in cell wall biosynthesis
MRIAFLAQAGVPDIRQNPLSGAANHVKQVFDAFHRQGHSVCLLAQLSKEIWKSDDFQTFEPITVRGFSTNTLRFFESAVRRFQSELQLPYIALFDSLRFAQACRQELGDRDIFYERMGWMGYGGAIAARRMNKPLVLEVNGDHLAEMELQGNAPKGAQRWLSSRVTRFAAHEAMHSVATGEGWRRRFIERWAVTPDRVSVVENGSELVDILTRDDLKAFCNGEEPERPVKIVYVGGFDPWHGLPILVRAAAQLAIAGIEFQLLLIGTGSGEDDIKELVRSCGLAQRVIFTGQVSPPEMAGYLSQADIGVSPYCGREEYSGLKLLDYKAAGLAIVASGKAGQPAIIEHARNGLIVPPCDELALSEALALLAADRGFRKRLGREARLDAEINHSWHNTTAQLIDIFNHLTPSEWEI